MDKFSGNSRSGSKPRIAAIVFALSLLVASALPLLPHSSADDQRDHKRNASVAAKRSSDRATKNDSPPNYQNPGFAQQLLDGGGRSGRILATADFDLIGLAVTAAPATQAVPKNTPTAILTSVQAPPGTDPAQIIAGLNPNYRVRGDLSGPSLTSPVSLEAKIGDPLPIPTLARAGDHAVQNLRVVDISVTGTPVVAPVTPDTCGIVVIEQLLISQVRVEEMSYDDIVRSGIAISDDSYRFFNFVLAFATSSGVQYLNAPVAFPPVGAEAPLPVVGRVTPPAGIGINVPDVVPVMLQTVGGGDEEEGGGTKLEFADHAFSIPGVVVFPGRIGLLNQFFEAIVIVANGAPTGTPLVVRNLHARAALPDNGTPADSTDDPLRIARTQVGGQVTDLALHGLGADGQYGTPDDTTRFLPGESGQGTFLLEGLKEGLHTPKFILEGTLDGLPVGPVTVRGEVPGSVLVRDASFAATFTHPSVVRAGQEYDLALTVFNTGSRDILGAIARLNANSISGAELLANDTGERPFATTIRKKDSSTVVWRLRSNTTGAVSASYVKVGQGIEAGIVLKTGVGDRNVPLSPDTLALPDPVKYLPPGTLATARELLGQAWSVATAPPGTLPQGVTPITKQIVVDRASELGSAGMRIAFNEPANVSVETVMRDWLGELQTNPDAGFADAQRDTPAGFRWFDSIGTSLYARLTSGQPAVTSAALHAELAAAESPRSAFISALVSQPSGPATFGARLIDPAGRRIGFGASATERLGELQSGASLQLSSADGTATTGQMILASRPIDGQWTLELNGWQSGAADVSLLVPLSGHTYRQIIFSGVQVSSGGRYRVTFRPTNSSTPVLEEFVNGSFRASTTTATITTLNEPAPRLIGAIQISPELIGGGDKYGRLVGLLFSKPMSQSSAETATRYKIGGGELVGSNPPQIVGGAIKVGLAKIDPLGGRFVYLSLLSPIGPYIRRDLTLTGVTDVRGVDISPAATNAAITIKVSFQGNPPGAYLTGRVLNADGTPVANSSVEWRAPICSGSIDLGQTVNTQFTDSQGRYGIDYVRNGDCGSPTFIATNPVNGAKKRIGTPVVYDGQHLVIDLVFLARGKVSGTVTISGSPAPNAFVRVVPLIDAGDARVLQADGAGRYLTEDVPVGNVSVLAQGAGSQSASTGFNSGTISGPGQTAVVNVSLQPLSGTARGRVVNPDAGQTPASGTLVVAWARPTGVQTAEVPTGFAYSNRDGSFTISNLPLTDARLEATDYITGLRVNTNIQLSQATREVNGILITLPGYGTVTGRVVNETGGFIPNAAVSGGGSQVLADALGFFTLNRLTAGNQTILAKEPLSGMTGSAAVTVLLGQTTAGVTIVITRPGTINGQVFVQGASGATPIAKAKVCVDGFHIVETDAQGRYTLSNVMPNSQLILRFVHPGLRLAVNTPTFVAPGETITRNATFRASTLRGKISQPDGAGAVAQLKMYVPLPVVTEGLGDFGLIGGADPIQTQSSSDGSYLVANLNPGSYRVTASSAFFPTKVSKIGTVLVSQEEICDITLVSTFAGKIQGRVFQPDGTTLAGAGIKVALGGGALANVTVQTDPAGHYEFAEVFAAGAYVMTATENATGNTNQIGISVRQNEDCVADIRLLGRGGLRVRVIDGAGVAVQGAQVNVNGTAYPHASRFGETTAPSNGVILFDNLNEGNYAVTATQSGISGRASASVPRGSTVEVTVQFQPSGTIEGRVLMPDGSTGVGLADVQLQINSRTLGVTVTSDAEGEVGKFTFLNVPAGDYTVEAFDNRTTRVGRSSVRITTQGQTASADIKLVALGAVTGRVTVNGAAVDHAAVLLTASGFVSTRLLATTTADGRYRFTGIPVGQFNVSVTNGPGGLTGSATGSIVGTIEPLADTTADIALTPSVTVTGTVSQFGGLQPAGGARVRLTVGGRWFDVLTDQIGTYRVEWVPLGDISVRAQAATGFDRGVAPVATASTAGATLTINVTLVGTGTITGEARDSDGITRLTSGSVKFTNSEIGDPVVLNAAVQSNGRYQISGAPAGAFTLSLTVPNRVGAGTANGALTANETLDLNVKLEDAGTITGAVKTAAALPVNSADITLTMQRPAGIVRFYAHTSPQGIYLFENIPLGTGSIAVLDTASGGLANASGISLTTNAQTFNVPDLILDSTPIRVDAVVPANGAVNVPRNSAVTITFSEPVLASTINSTNLKLLQGATAIGSSLAISPDGKTVTLTPAALADFTSYTIVVTTNVKDLVGLRLESEFRSSFVTRDETGPLVVAVNPLNNAVQVALTTDVQVTFDEAIDAAQNLLSVVKLSLGATPVAGTVTLGGNGTVATFRPTSALIESTLYTINVVGQRDVFQNVTTAPPVVSSFTTVDLTPPVVDPLPIDGARLQTFTPAITATYHDNLTGINTASVVLKLDNTTVTSGVSVTAAGLTFTPSSPLAKGNHTVTVQVADNAGNLSAIRSATFSIDDSAPVIASFTIGGVNAVNGMSVSSTLRPVFAATYSDDSGISIANTKLLFGPAGSTPPQVAATVTATSLTFQPAANLAEGQYTAQLIVVDTIGNTTTAGQLAVTIDVDAAEITTVTPSHGNQHGSTTVVLTGNRLLNSAGTPPASVILGGYAAQVTGAVAGSPDQLTIVTPAGAPGAATITISTDRGVGSLVGGFIYDADPKTPFAVEPDTLLLWHLDETANGAVTVLDAGQLTQEGTAGSVSQAATGRFGGARLNASITGEVDLALLSPGSSSLTAECWIKSAPVPRTYVLIGKSRTPFGDFDDFNLLLLPSGALQGYLYDTGNRLWTVTTPVTPATSDDVDDGQWHSIAMVVDRAANKLSIYVDGAERESAGPPTGFVAMRNQGHPFGAGHYLNAVGGTGPAEFPGVLDEIRLSNTAHTADVIQRTYLGTQGSLGLYVSTSAPSTIARGTATDFVARGYNLSNLNATFTDSSGAQIPAQVIATSATHTLIRMSPGSGAALGVAQLVLSSPAGSIALQVYVVDLERNLYGVEADTLLLWHLDEPGNGAARVIDSGAFSFDATAGTVSQAVAGRFSGGRSNASIAGDTDSSTLSPGAASFTAECWMKTDPVPRTYVLIGKSRTPFGDFDDFNLLLLPSGALQGYLYDTGNRLWSVIMPATSSDDVDDGRWHSVAMVVDRGASKLSIYVDGVERASGGPPAGFVAMRNQGWPFGAGHYLSAVGGTGPAEFPGVLDEIRLSGTAHTATRVLEDFRGNSGLRVTSYGPKEVGRDRAVATPHSTQLTIVGYNLENVSAHVVRDGQPIDVGVALNDSSYRQAHLTLSVGQSVSLGPAQVILSKASQPDVALNVQITEESLYAVEEDTLLLWHLDEPANGAARVVDSGPLSIDGTAGTISQAVAGRFNGGRSNASITADTDIGALSLGAASFTAECWMKTDPVPRTYVLIGKSRTPFGDFDDFSLLLLPSGALQGYLYDTGNRLWSVIMPATSSDDVDDGQWHSVAMVVDRGASKLSIYVDGVERASGGPPAGFVTMRNQGWPFGAGHYLNAAGGSGPAEFPGVLDEIRLSSTAHSAAKISSDFFGFNGVRVTSVSPSIVQRGAMPATFRFYGTGLTGATVTSSVSGAAVSVTSTSYTRLDFTLGVPGTTSPGPLSLTVRDSLGQITTAELTVVDQQPFTNDPAGSSETILLWHLDEAGNAAVPIIGSGDPVLPAVIGGSAAAISQAAAGRFGGARVSASIAGDSSSSSYSIASSSFTAECWMKSDPGARTYVLVGKSRTPFGDFDDFNLLLLPSGGVQGYLYDNGNRLWSVTVEPVTYDASGQSTVVRLDDGQWHLVSMVVDRTASKLSLFVDGVERASGGPPAGFGAMRNQGWPLGAGHYLNAAGGTGPAEFPGTLDEIRIVNFARTAAQIHDTWFGTTTTGLNTTPLRFFKSIEPVFALKLGQDSASQPRPPTSPPGPQSSARSPRTSRATGGDR